MARLRVASTAQKTRLVLLLLERRFSPVVYVEGGDSYEILVPDLEQGWFDHFVPTGNHDPATCIYCWRKK